MIVDYKWKAFAQRMHLEWMRMVLWTMMLQRVLSNPTFFDPEATQLPWWEYGVMAFVVVYSISPTLNFCGKLIVVEGWRNLLAVDSAASWVDLGWTSCIAWDIAYTILKKNSIGELEGTRLSSLQSWTMTLLWVRLFLFLIPFEVGRFSLIDVEIAKRLKYFFGLLGLTILAFADVMYEAKGPDRYAATVVEGRPYRDMVLGIFRLTIIGDPQDAVVPTPSNRNQITLTVLFVLAVLVIGLTLLNMLIAIMTAVFDEAEDRAEARLYLCRARLILEFESAMGEREITQQQREAWFPPFLHVMRPLKHEALQALFDEDGGLKKLLHHWPRFGANLASRQSQHSQHAAGTR